MTTETLTFLEKVEQDLPVTEQEVFDHAVNGVLRQDAVANDFLTCRYRWHSNTGLSGACAVGQCIPDALYDPDIEGMDVQHLATKRLVPRSLTPHIALLCRLQSDHDNARTLHAFCDHAFFTAGLFGLSTENIIEI
jgi:hypothetical protein